MISCPQPWNFIVFSDFACLINEPTKRPKNPFTTMDFQMWPVRNFLRMGSPGSAVRACASPIPSALRGCTSRIPSTLRASLARFAHALRPSLARFAHALRASLARVAHELRASLARFAHALRTSLLCWPPRCNWVALSCNCKWKTPFLTQLQLSCNYLGYLLWIFGLYFFCIKTMCQHRKTRKPDDWKLW